MSKRGEIKKRSKDRRTKGDIKKEIVWGLRTNITTRQVSKSLRGAEQTAKDLVLGKVEGREKAVEGRRKEKRTRGGGKRREGNLIDA